MGFREVGKRWLKVRISEFSRVRRLLELKKKLATVTKVQLMNDLRLLGIAPGDTIFVHSSLKSIGYVEGGAWTVLEALYASVNPDGTVIIPTYYMPYGSMYETCLMGDEYVFDPQRDGTNLGIIPSTFLKFPEVYRSIHPTHSVSAVGKYGKYIVKDHHMASSTFGRASPWQRLIELDGKVLGLGISMGPVTFYHTVEDMVNEQFPLPVKIDKTYTLKCRDWDGSSVEVKVRPLDPKYARQRIDHPDRNDLRTYFWKEFSRAGLLITGKVGEAIAWHIKARGFYDYLVELMNDGITIYSTEDELGLRG